jgi:transcriptional regulator with GAF, ATPase, and Fis domain
MEAELFGHVKGAFTGAQGASSGRILQAEGGTLFLDEIGELPLDVQAKLLRFVQEKEINPVGGGQTRKVDVRIVAATNRDLALEVAEGRFRGDLYYRLQVITLLAPPLRERTDDIIPLARYFLEKFANQYQKGMLHLSDEVENALLAYQWPGNIRELQNTIMRAAVISKNDRIDLDVLNLKPIAFSRTVDISQRQIQPTEPDLMQMPVPVGGVNFIEQQLVAQPHVEVQKSIDIWEQLRNSLISKIQTILKSDKVIAVPLGRWLAEDLMLEADRFENNVVRRASKRLGLSETTLRRQVEKLKQAELAGVLSRTAEWQSIQPILKTLIKSLDEIASQNIIEQVRTILLQEIIKSVPKDKSLGSALMGVTIPTYQRWIEKIQD